MVKKIIRGLPEFLKKYASESFKAARSMKNEKKLPEVSTLSVAISVLKFLRCSRMIGEAAYGFLPFGIKNGIATGDGQDLWGLLLQKENRSQYPALSNKLLEFTSLIMLAPSMTGVGKALYLSADDSKRGQ